MLNLFAYRATDPKDMLAAKDPVGTGNDEAILRVTAEAGFVVVAWGKHGAHMGRGMQVLRMLQAPHCLGWNRDGSPVHPLYQPASVAPTPFTATGN